MALRQRALLTALLPWTVVRNGEAAVEAPSSHLKAQRGLGHEGRDGSPDVSRDSTSGWVERSRRDRSSLAALVAESISADPNETYRVSRSTQQRARLDASPTSAAAVGYLEDLPKRRRLVTAAH